MNSISKSLLFILLPLLLLCSCREQSKSQSVAISDMSLLTQEYDDPIADYVVEIHEDKRGNLWFGTMAKGVGRFDGENLEFFDTADGVCSNTISSIIEDEAGVIWLAGHTGLCTYDYREDNKNGPTFRTLTKTSGQHDAGTGWVSIKQDRLGRKWQSTSLGLYRFEDNVPVKVTLPIDKSEITSYAITAGKAWLEVVDKDGNEWYSTDGYGAIMYDGETYTRFTKSDGLCSNNVNSIKEDQQGNLWFACMQSYQPAMTGDGGVCRYDYADKVKGTKKMTLFPTINGLNNADIYTIFVEQSGAVWIGATGTGAYRYVDGEFTLYDETDRPDLNASFGLQAMVEDQLGELWFGFSGGLFKFKNSRFVHISEASLISERSHTD